jgi:TPR repeat protein
VERDDVRAAHWYGLAADQGDASAQNNLGVMFASGQGVQQDDRRAVYWYTQAAEQGHALAQYNLGGMYNSGRGVARDPVRAYMWMLLAADGGDATANVNKTIVARRLSPSEIGHAIDLSHRWQLSHREAAGRHTR